MNSAFERSLEGISSAGSSVSSTSISAAVGSSVLSTLGSKKVFVGGFWVLSSALLTTYSTTKFLKYEDKPHELGDRGDFLSRVKKASSDASSSNQDTQRIPTMSRPALLTLYRFAGSLLLGIVIGRPYSAILDRIRMTKALLPAFALPASFLFCANFCNSVALDKIGISLTYTSKCGIPLITVLITLLLDGTNALPSVPALLSLIPIALGIGAASWNHPTFEPVGFAAAIVSCVAQASLNVTSKKAMMRTASCGVDAQRTMVALALCITTVTTLLVNAIRGLGEEQVLKREKTHQKGSKLSTMPPGWLTSLAVAAYHVEYVFSFMFVRIVEPITYGTCDAIRRLAIIVSGQQMFGGEPFTKLNVAGIALSLLGALSFAINK